MLESDLQIAWDEPHVTYFHPDEPTFFDVTDPINSSVHSFGLETGIVFIENGSGILVPQESYRGVEEDLMSLRNRYQKPDEWATLFQSPLAFPVENRNLVVGEFQRIFYLLETATGILHLSIFESSALQRYSFDTENEHPVWQNLADKREKIFDLTEHVQELSQAAATDFNIQDGGRYFVYVGKPHTTCYVDLADRAESLHDRLDKLVPRDDGIVYIHDRFHELAIPRETPNGRAHVSTAISKQSLDIPFEDGQLVLKDKRIFLHEFDAREKREVFVALYAK